MTAAEPTSELRELQPAAVVDGRYVVKREIARGAMGVVSEAVHATMRSPVALKTLTAAAADWSAGKARLMREARLMALCKHESVAIVHDAGTCAVHGPYVALEMLDGRSLDGLLAARGCLDVGPMARVGVRIAAGLAHVHAHGVVHRDVKPANIIIGRGASGAETAHLIDFGIATVATGAKVSEPRLTAANEILGTVAFMAPEVLLQEATASFASDVYALGCLLYECLSGQLPHPGTASSISTAHAVGKAVAPIRTVRPEVPEALDAIVCRALARDPSARPSVGELGRVCVEIGRSRPEGTLLGLAAPPAAVTQRQFARAAYSAPARIVAPNGAYDGRTEDISEGGVLVVAPAECAAGDKVTVRFPLPISGRVVVAVGLTRWIKAQRGRRAIGIAFQALSAEAAEEIRTYASAMEQGVVRDGVAQTLWSARS